MIYKYLLISLIVLSFFNYSIGQNNNYSFSRGVPACPYPFDYTQPDGKTINITFKGDNVLNWAKTADGYTVIKNESGTYEYATKSADGNLISSGIQAHNLIERNSTEVELLNKTPKDLMFSKKQINSVNNNFKTKNQKLNKSVGTPFPSIGSKKLLVILVNFSNTTPSSANNQTAFDNYMNGSNISFKKYYQDNSYNKLTITSTVYTWVDVSNTHNYYGANDSLTCKLIYEAVQKVNIANPSLNFSDYDNNGDGVCDDIVVIHQGTGEETSGNTYDIWSHSMDIRAYQFNLTIDGVKIGPYVTTPEKNNYGSMSGIGIICHEFGHALGGPDTYATDYSNEGLGNWDIMAAGAWLAKPCNHTCWFKMARQWITVKIISTAQTDTLRNPLNYGDCYRFNTPTYNEYFMLENRQQTGWDQYIPGHGMLIYHIDGPYNNLHIPYNDINDSVSHQGIDIEEAGTSLTTTNDGDASNPFPGSTGQTSFTDATAPNSHSWAGANTNKPITSITENTSTDIITFKFMGGGTTAIENTNIVKSKELNIYPNPTNNIINIQLGDVSSSQVSIKIFNVLGVSVYEKTEKSNNNYNKSIDLSSFGKGIYFVVIESGKDIYKRKVVCN